jgi:hypothetical protein
MREPKRGLETGKRGQRPRGGLKVTSSRKIEARFPRLDLLIGNAGG